MKTTALAALMMIACGALVGSPDYSAWAQCDGSCGITGCGDITVCRGHGGRAGSPASRGGVVAHFPSDGTMLLLPRCTGAHGTRYGRPYNYRNLLDYPWHARLRNVNSEGLQPTPAPVIQLQPFGDDSPVAPPAAPPVESFDSAWIRSTDSAVQKTSLQFVR